MKQPRFIVFDGLDGSGKSTQLSWLAQWLTEQRIDFVATKEPGGTEFGSEIRNILLNPKLKLEPEVELMLFAADRLHHVEEVILPNLAQGNWVLCDRFVESTYAYQSFGRELGTGVVEEINRVTGLNIESDITFWLDVDYEVSRSRLLNLDRIEQEDRFFFDRVRKGYEYLHQQDPKRIIKVDGNRDAETVHREIRAKISERF